MLPSTSKNINKTLISTLSWLFNDFLSLKTDVVVQVPTKSKKQKTFKTAYFFLASWEPLTLVYPYSPNPSVSDASCSSTSATWWRASPWSWWGWPLSTTTGTGCSSLADFSALLPPSPQPATGEISCCIAANTNRHRYLIVLTCTPSRRVPYRSASVHVPTPYHKYPFVRARCGAGQWSRSGTRTR